MNSVMKEDLAVHPKKDELLNNYEVVCQINTDLNDRVEKLFDGFTELLEWLIDTHPTIAAEYYKEYQK